MTALSFFSILDMWDDGFGVFSFKIRPMYFTPYLLEAHLIDFVSFAGVFSPYRPSPCSRKIILAHSGGQNKQNIK